MQPQAAHHPQGPGHCAGLPWSMRLIRQWQPRHAVPARVFRLTSSTVVAWPTTMAVWISSSVMRSQKQITVPASPRRMERSEGWRSDIRREQRG